MATLRTPLCEMLGIEHPILSVGMADLAGPELVAAVSNAGACGVLGGVPRESMRERIARTRQLTDRPFGANQIIASYEEDDEADRAELDSRIAALFEAKVSPVVLFWGSPRPWVDRAHANGLRLIVQTGSVEESERAAEAGVDAVIAQGVEAGGHVKATESLWTVLPLVVKAIAPVPVIASGGIGDGAAIARALEAGAQGVSMGTRFVATTEAWTHGGYKQRIVDGRSDETLVTGLFDVWWPDAPHRVLRNRIVREWEEAGRPPPGRRADEDLPIGNRRRPWGELQAWPRYAVGAIPPDFEGDLEEAPLFAGTSVDAVHEIKPAAEVITDLVREAEAALR